MRRLKPFTLLINWEADDANICPSSVAKYFHDLNYGVKLCKPALEIRTEYSVAVPEYNEDNADEFIEWLGTFSVQADMQFNSTDDSYLTNYTIPEPFKEYGQVKMLQWKGFFNSQQIERLFLQIT